MRRIRIAAVSVMVAAGFVGAVAAPASAAKPPNYGTCVVIGVVSPADGGLGPLNVRGEEASDERGGSVNTGIEHSGGKPRFTAGAACGT
jgi:hypothetical protein